MSATGQMFEQLEHEVIKLRKQLHAYQATINRIDDFFEYTNESKSDRQFIHERLDGLADILKSIENK